MFKNKLNYKLVNFGILVLIIYLMYQTGNLWTGVLSGLADVFMPFFFAFAIAYALYPTVCFLRRHKFPKGVAVGVTFALLLAVIAIFFGIAVPAIYNQLGGLYNNIISFVQWASEHYNVDSSTIQSSLSEFFKNIASSLSTYASSGVVNVISKSLNLFVRVAICLAAVVYFLSDMDKIRINFKSYLKKKNVREFKYFQELDRQMKAYVIGFFKVAGIAFVEYSILYSIVGHPNAFLLAFLMVLANLIPYLGGITVNILAAITAFAVSPALFINTCIAFIVGSTIDGYVVGPLVYGKSNKIHPLVSIFSVFAGGLLFGVVGVIISIPVTVIIMTTAKYYGEDIENGFNELINNAK
jgi:predicted PurR-regulated permease PerM